MRLIISVDFNNRYLFAITNNYIKYIKTKITVIYKQSTKPN